LEGSDRKDESKIKEKKLKEQRRIGDELDRLYWEGGGIRGAVWAPKREWDCGGKNERKGGVF